MRRRARRPRRLGILTSVSATGGHGGRQGFPYAVGDRIAGDLMVIGHLAAGRLGHLYQVWSASEWTAMTCKILAPRHRGDRQAIATLRREARILRRLEHPNLVRSYGGGEHDGLPFVLMEYLEGPTVFDLLERRPGRRLGVADAVRTALHVGAGLHHLHRRGFLHLDLKPANLLLRDSLPVLVDFDVARPIEPSRRPREAPGTAPYMAPEHVERGPLGPAADVYGLGALLYELVTGRWPFEAVYTHDEPRSGAELSHPQLGHAPPPPPARYNPEISPSLNDLVLRCLERDPAARFPDMHALLLSLADELPEPAALWPEGTPAERRRSARPGASESPSTRARRSGESRSVASGPSGLEITPDGMIPDTP